MLACVSAAEASARREAVRQLAAECSDWDWLIESARRHGVTALLSSALDSAASNLVPENVLRTLRQRFRSNAARNLFLTRELLGLIRDFAVAGIPVIPFKGPALAISAYGNVALREFLDLDILVPKQDLERARHLLRERGFLQPDNQLGAQETPHIKSQLGCDFFRPTDRLSIELHWSLVQKWLGFDVDLTAVWKAPDRMTVGGVTMLGLPVEILLLYLCAHGTKHRWSRLCWVIDISRVINRNALDWNSVLKTAHRMGCQRTLFLALHLARNLLGDTFPAHVWKRVERDTVAANLARQLATATFSADPAAGHSTLEKDWFYLQTKERWRERFRYSRYWAGWFLAPSAKDKHWVALPSGLRWLYFLLRPIRVSWELARRPRVLAK